MKIASIVGARPQFIKAFPVCRALRKEFKEILIHTGQHYDEEMSALFFEELGIPEPDYNLGVGSDSQARQTAEMLIRIEEVLLSEKPDLVLVYGDTNSTLAGALATAKLHIPLAHVEAGLRSYDKSMPEETNRVLTDHTSDFLFCPTETAVNNLKVEGFTNILNEGKLIPELYNSRLPAPDSPLVCNVGDVMYDAALIFQEVAKIKSNILNRLNLKEKSYFLLTIHRASNTDVRENLEKILDAIIETGEKIVFPVHPRTKKYLKGWNLLEKIDKSGNILLTPPLGYLDFLVLEKNAAKILTDSGGVQKEAYFYGVPCITLRETTEWVETVESGWNILVGTEKEKIIEAVKSFSPTKERENYYGDGNAALKIRQIITRGVRHRATS